MFGIRTHEDDTPRTVAPIGPQGKSVVRFGFGGNPPNRISYHCYC